MTKKNDLSLLLVMDTIKLTTTKQIILANIISLAGYLLFSIPAFYLSVKFSIIAPVWPQSGLALAALIICGYRIWPAIFIGTFLAHGFVSIIYFEQSFFHILPMSFLLGLTGTMEVILGYYILHKNLKSEILFFSFYSVKIYLFSIVAMSFLGSLTGTTFHLLAGSLSIHHYLYHWLSWWFADAIGIALFGTFLISFLPYYKTKWEWSQFIHYTFLLLAIIIIEYLIIRLVTQSEWLSHMPFYTLPILLWIAYRFSLKAVSGTLVITSIFTVWLVIIMQAPMPANEMRIFLFEVQAFTAISVVSFLMINAAFNEIKISNDRMMKTHEELEQKVLERTQEIQSQLDKQTLSINHQEELLRKLKTQNESKDKVFSVIAHDLRNPIGSLLGYGELLVKNIRLVRSEEAEGMIRNMNRNIRGVYSLLDNLLNWSKIQAGTLKYKPQVIDLKIIVEENIDLLERVCKEKNIMIVNDLEEYTLAYADPNMISVVLRNILSNAIKYSFPGQIILVSAELTDNNLWLVTVKDEGVGMSSDDLSLILNPETTFESKPGTMEEKGTGLGLKIVKDFVERNCGTLWLESEKGAGTIFKFTVPKKLTSRK